MNSPVIGIMGYTMRHRSSAYGDVKKLYANQKYVAAVEQNGGIPLILPVCGNPEKLRIMISLCDGLLLPGGEDVDPALYGEAPHRKLGEIHPEDDRFLINALKLAREFQLPCLGICKGAQMMAVFSGGSLYQDIHAQLGDNVFLHCQNGGRDYLVHSVQIDSSSHLFQIMGQEQLGVNSMHHQSIREPGNGLVATAHAADGIVEALESQDGLWVGVQWHPEELTETAPIMNRLFADLVDRASKRRNSK